MYTMYVLFTNQRYQTSRKSRNCSYKNHLFTTQFRKLQWYLLRSLDAALYRYYVILISNTQRQREMLYHTQKNGSRRCCETGKNSQVDVGWSSNTAKSQSLGKNNKKTGSVWQKSKRVRKYKTGRTKQQQRLAKKDSRSEVFVQKWAAD